MGVNGKQKGASFERDTCTRLSIWASNGERKDLFWRSAMSGGRATIQLRKGQDNQTQSGDISSIDTLGNELTQKFICECKFYKSLELVPGLVHHRGALHSFWVKLVKDSAAAKKQPLLIAKQNHLPTLVLVTAMGATLLNIKKSAWLATLVQWQSEVYLFEGLLTSDYPF